MHAFQTSATSNPKCLHIHNLWLLPRKKLKTPLRTRLPPSTTFKRGPVTLAIALPPPPASGLSLTVRTISPTACLNRFTCVLLGLSRGFFGLRGLRGLGGLSGSFGLRFLGTFLPAEPVEAGVKSSSSGVWEGVREGRRGIAVGERVASSEEDEEGSL
jgi:hypothetical protein